MFPLRSHEREVTVDPKREVRSSSPRIRGNVVNINSVKGAVIIQPDLGDVRLRPLSSDDVDLTLG